MATNGDKPEKEQKVRPVRLPSASISEVDPVVRTLAGLGGPSSAPLLAQQRQTTASSSRFQMQLASAKLYGLISGSGAQLDVSDRGRALVSGDPDQETTARREAFMSTGFGRIAYRLRGRAADAAVIALRLQQDFGIADDAATVAERLITSAREASLIENASFDVQPIEQFQHLIPADGQATARPAAQTKARTKRAALEPAETTGRESPKKTHRIGREDARPFGGLQIVLRVDLGNLPSKELVELVRDLQAIGVPSEIEA
ncbi:MAG: hypothetical protein ABR548_05515 [Actinomycetota bacterium]|nr:hypothetical protein [Actinomycetota bacterium]